MKRLLHSTLTAFIVTCLLASCCNLFGSSKKMEVFNAYHERLLAVCDKNDDFFNKEFVPYVDKIPSKKMEGEQLQEIQNKLDGFIEEYSKIRDEYKAIKPVEAELIPMHQDFIDYSEKRMEALELLKKGFERDASFIVVLEDYKKLLAESETSLTEFGEKKKAYFKKYNLVEK